MHIHSDCPTATSHIEAIHDCLIEAGAQIPEALVTVIQNGEMHLEYRDKIDLSSPPVFSLPEKCLVPLPEDLSFCSLENGKISIRTRPGGLSDLQSKLLDQIFGLYNALDKVRNYGKSSFWVSVDTSDPFWLPLLQLRSQSHVVAANRAEIANADLSEDDRLLRLFLNSRTLGWLMTGEVQTKRVLIPIIDMANHHDEGAPFSKVDEASYRPAALAFAMQKCIDTDQVFANYGKKDSLDLFFNYSYPDTYTSIIRSCPLSVPVSSKLDLSIGSGSAQLGAPISFREPGFLRISSLMWDADKLPGSLLMPIAKLISLVGKQWLDDSDDVRQSCNRLIITILELNLERYSLACSLYEKICAGNTIAGQEDGASSKHLAFAEQALQVIRHQETLIEKSLPFFQSSEGDARSLC